ncbi:MAG: HlyD family efflux transporter periplasmic adaptor subunit [Fuerstiella sp.]
MTTPTNANSKDLRNQFRFQPAEKPITEPSRTAPAAAAAPKALRTRPRGRLLIAGLMFAACAGGIATVWDSLLRYQAYGVVTGKVIEISAPIGGVLKYVHVREGDEVRQDVRLATVFDLENEQKLERIEDELRVAEATLHAETAKVQWQAQVQDTEMSKSLADFYEGAGQVFETNGDLGVIRNELERTKALIESKAAREVDLKTQVIQEQAQQEKLASVQQALKVLKDRAEAAANSPRLGAEQLAPLVAKVDMLLNETKRIRDWASQGELRAPVNGTVLHRHHPAGECVKSHEPLFSVIEESSLEIELYLPQEITDKYKVGDTVKLKIEPFTDLVPCKVTAIGTEHRQPPSNIEVFYRKDVKLLPIRVQPPAELAGDKRMSIGAVAKLPHFAGRG